MALSLIVLMKYVFSLFPNPMLVTMWSNKIVWPVHYVENVGLLLDVAQIWSTSNVGDYVVKDDRLSICC